MSLVKSALLNLRAKRSLRIEQAQKQSKEPEFATYEGKSLIDGTDIVRVGSNDPVSGFRVISNAPLSIGEKVSLRPSAIGGLQRVDARNRPIAEIPQISINFKLLESFLGFRIGNTIANIVTVPAATDQEIEINNAQNTVIYTSARFNYPDREPSAFFNGFTSFNRIGSDYKFEYANIFSEYVLSVIIQCEFSASVEVIETLKSKKIKVKARINEELYESEHPFVKDGNTYLCVIDQVFNINDAETIRPTVVNVFYSFSAL